MTQEDRPKLTIGRKIETAPELIIEGLAAQLYKIENPHGPLWHVLRENLRRRWRVKAEDHIVLTGDNIPVI